MAQAQTCLQWDNAGQYSGTAQYITHDGGIKLPTCGRQDTVLQVATADALKDKLTV
jgi:hypothetical protein